jgi:hypothetical protein
MDDEVARRTRGADREEHFGFSERSLEEPRVMQNRLLPEFQICTADRAAAALSFSARRFLLVCSALSPAV